MDCQKIFEKISEGIPIPTREKCADFDNSKRMALQSLKKAGKAEVANQYRQKSSLKSAELEVQGQLAILLEEEKTNMAWQSLIFAVPRGVMAFAARAATNSLASPDNLARWKKIVHPKCPLCSITPCTLGHLLNNCQEALDRYEWRHNNIVKYLQTTFSSQGMEAVEVYSDLEGHRINGVTVPPNIAITGLKPDLVIVKRQSSPPEDALVELTVPWDSSSGMENARKRKDDRYEKLTSDIEEQGFRCFNIPLEVGARGFINNRNRGVISHICKIMNIRKVSQVFKNCSKLALLGSYVIWNARHSQDWTSGQYLSP